MPQSLWEYNRRNAGARHFVSGLSIFLRPAFICVFRGPGGLLGKKLPISLLQGMPSEVVWIAAYPEGGALPGTLAGWSSDSRRSSRAARLGEEPTSYHSTTMRWFQGSCGLGSAAAGLASEDRSCAGGGVALACAVPSVGGAMLRASMGKSSACCVAHLAANPFSGLLVLYS